MPSTPEGLNDNQLMRALTLGMAVVWTATSDISLRETMNIARNMETYIESGQKPQ